MEWFWASVSYACLAAIGALTLFVMVYWFEAAREAARAKSENLARVNSRQRR